MASTSKSSVKSTKSSQSKKRMKLQTLKQKDPFEDPEKQLRPYCNFCMKPPKKPPLFNKSNLPFTTSTTSASWMGGTCCIRVREMGVSIDPPEAADLIKSLEARRYPKKRKWVYRTPSDLERQRERDYRLTLKHALKEEKCDRKLGIQRLEQKKRQLAYEVGPAWYQELSYNQIECMNLLGGAIAADKEEGLIARTQRLLDRLGVVPRHANKYVSKAMDKCGLNPIIFLIYLFKFTSELGEDCLTPDSRFSINDRLLLSGLAYIALPVTMLDLHNRVPPPLLSVPPPQEKCPKKRQIFTSPYLEPHPLCLKKPLINRSLERKRKQLAKKGNLIRQSPKKVEPLFKEELLNVTTLESTESFAASTSSAKKIGTRFALDSPKSGSRHLLDIKGSVFSVAMFEHAMRQLGKGSATDCSSSFIAEKDRRSVPLQNQQSTKTNDVIKTKLELQMERENLETEEETEIRTETIGETYSVQGHGNVTYNIPNKSNKKTGKTTTQKAINQSSKMSTEKKDSKPKWIIPEIIITYAPDEPEFDYDYYPYVFDENYEYQYDKPPVVEEPDKESPENISDDVEQEEPFCNCERARAAREQQAKPRSSWLSTGSSDLHFSESDILPCPIRTVPALKAAFMGYWSGVLLDSDVFQWEEEEEEERNSATSSETENKGGIRYRLLDALDHMAKKGNILAALPDVHKLPVFQYWFKCYKGFKLNPDTKVQLMQKSVGRWGQLQQHPRYVRLPSLNLKNPSKLNWHCKHWLMNKVNNMFQKYYSDMRKAHVEDAREYWCTMCMEYFTNPEFKNVFYTYLPSKEEDVLAVRLWDGMVYNKK